MEIGIKRDILNQMGRKIEVFTHNPKWKDSFKKEANQLSSIFKDELLKIHHIGSTAIPGIKAKPVIDILVVIKNIKIIDKFNKQMIKLGYRPRGECLDNTIPGTPGRFYFSKDTDGIRSHQVHVCEKGHFDIKDKIAFRDYMRTHHKEAQEYSVV